MLESEANDRYKSVRDFSKLSKQFRMLLWNLAVKVFQGLKSCQLNPPEKVTWNFPSIARFAASALGNDRSS